MSSLVNLLALAAAISFSSPQATVGEPVEVRAALAPGQSLEVAPAPCLEVIERTAEAVSIRSFLPGDCEVVYAVVESGQVVARGSSILRIESVLEENDSLEPAPLKPPLSIEPGRWTDAALWSACSLALFGWIALVFLGRRRTLSGPSESLRSAREELFTLIARLSGRSDREAAALLADGVRRFLHRRDRRLGAELTTTELLERFSVAWPDSRPRELLRRILTTGDRAKFSTWPVQLDPQLIEEAALLEELPAPGSAGDRPAAVQK
jgi:hypothetical protein